MEHHRARIVAEGFLSADTEAHIHSLIPLGDISPVREKGTSELLALSEAFEELCDRLARDDPTERGVLESTGHRGSVSFLTSKSLGSSL